MSDFARVAREFVRLVEIMATLRGPSGCPWDREQTIDTLKPFVLEETYEVLDAIDRHDHAALREELGDFVFEAVFLAQLEAEAGHFSIDDSLQIVADKLVRRHPHVFKRDEGEPALGSAGDVRVRWEEIKALERGHAKDTKRTTDTKGTTETKTLLSGIAPTMPALLRAYHIGSRAASVGFDWHRADDVVDKIQEEVDELREVTSDSKRAEEELGDLLFAIANLARKLSIEPETALRKANEKFTKRFNAMEQTIVASGRTIPSMSLEELESAWRSVKSQHENTKEDKSTKKTS